jgi:hypothetical protein
VQKHRESHDRMNQRLTHERLGLINFTNAIVEQEVREQLAEIESGFRIQLQAKDAALRALDESIPAKIQEALRTHGARHTLANCKIVNNVVHAEEEERFQSISAPLRVIESNREATKSKLKDTSESLMLVKTSVVQLSGKQNPPVEDFKEH